MQLGTVYFAQHVAVNNERFIKIVNKSHCSEKSAGVIVLGNTIDTELGKNLRKTGYNVNRKFASDFTPREFWTFPDIRVLRKTLAHNVKSLEDFDWYRATLGYAL